MGSNQDHMASRSSFRSACSTADNSSFEKPTSTALALSTDACAAVHAIRHIATAMKGDEAFGMDAPTLLLALSEKAHTSLDLLVTLLDGRCTDNLLTGPSQDASPVDQWSPECIADPAECVNVGDHCPECSDGARHHVAMGLTRILKLLAEDEVVEDLSSDDPETYKPMCSFEREKLMAFAIALAGALERT